jgi:large subunit ribosomal protein L29
MLAEEIRSLSDDDLEQAIDERRKERFNLRFQTTLGQVADTNRPRTLRREIARLLTIRRERELWAEYEAQADDGSAG